ncbi:MAG: phytanoyl-CoA dioxygenase family protein [Microcoleaceae cyanobacterium]
MINSSFKLTEQDIANLKKQGFIKLKGFLAPEAIKCLDEILEQDLEDANAAHENIFSKYKYDMESNKDLEIIQHPVFQSTLAKLCQCSLLYAQHLGFEIEKNTNPGLKWHVDTLSFAYQQLEDFACTLWIPLTKIDTNAQGGGMSYVSKEKLSGKFLYDYASILSSYVQDLQAKDAAPSKEEMERLEYFMVSSPEVDTILRTQAEMDDFELGDVLLWDKEVIHRTCLLTEGPINTRRAFIMRFIAADSTYDLERVQKLKPYIDILNYDSYSTFALNVCKEEGELIIDSPLFKTTKAQRLISLMKEEGRRKKEEGRGKASV